MTAPEGHRFDWRTEALTLRARLAEVERVLSGVKPIAEGSLLSTLDMHACVRAVRALLAMGAKP